jgi:hypothetical protein
MWGAFLAAGIAELLHCEKSCNALEYRRILQNGLLPTNEKLLSKDFFFQQTMILPKLQRQSRSGLQTSPSGLCFGLVRVQI